MGKNNAYQITVAGIAIKVTKKNVKHLRIVAYPSSGEVRISSPRNIPDSEVKDFAHAKAGWIKKHVNISEIKQVDKNLEFKNGSTHFIWGIPHTLKMVSSANGSKLHVNGSQVIEMCNQRYRTSPERERALREWYRSSIKSKIPSIIKKWEPIMRVEVKDWGVKKMKTRWGTCNTKAKRIWINLELAKRNPEVLEYIVVHEMTHLLERKHSKRFYKLMDSFLPHWRDLDQQLGGKHWRRF